MPPALPYLLMLLLLHAFLFSIFFTSTPPTMAFTHSSGFHLPILYKFSHAFVSQMQRRGFDHPPLPHAGSLEHYQMLSLHDHHRHRRLLLNDPLLQYSLSPSNESFFMDALGLLHYTFVTIGTPSHSYFVALDTGSDLLWIPCNCLECAEANWSKYGISLKDFEIYSTSNSSTSKVISCDDPICASNQLHPSCDSTRTCNYNISYVSANTSSSGIIVQDVLSLNAEDEKHGSIKTPIYFGCGERQTGLFSGAAVDGLFGLGPDVYSVPSTLSKNDIVPNVFSMCFSLDGSGRLVFGKMPSSTSRKTPLIPRNSSDFYVLEVTNLLIGASNISLNSSNWIFDTGTSLTTLPTELVTTLGELINENIGFHSSSLQLGEDFILRYCWNLINGNDLPNLTIVFGGGASWDIQTPYLQVTLRDDHDRNDTTVFTCLGMVDSDYTGLMVIGLNFMMDYEYFFDHGSMTFSWAPSDCYTLDESESQISPAPSPQTPIGSFDGISPSSEIGGPSQFSPGQTSKSKLKSTPFIWEITILFIATISLSLL